MMPALGDSATNGTTQEVESRKTRRARSRPPITQAVILAAGAGTRLQADDAPLSKPLVRVAGLSLLERAIRVCWQAGVSEVVVVIGFEHVALVTELARLRARYGLTVTPVLNAQWALGNGASAMAAESYVRGAFFLMMCDHIVEPAFFHRLVAGDDGRACAVVIDRDFDAIFDIEEATKVRLVGPDLTGIGKDLVLHDAVDTGVFLCRPPLFEALRDAASVGLWALSDGVRLLALRREVGWVDGTGLRWFDVDTLDDLQHAEQGLDGSPLPHDRSGHPAPHPLSAGDN